MARLYRLNKEVTLDLNRVLTMAATEDGIRLTYLNAEEETITAITTAQRDRLLDHWLGT
jgi:hypothetical protein